MCIYIYKIYLLLCSASNVFPMWLMKIVLLVMIKT